MKKSSKRFERTTRPIAQPHKGVLSLPTPRTWKDMVLSTGKSQADLMRITGASSAAISQLFERRPDGSERVKQSRLRAAIDRELGITESGVDPMKAAIDADWILLDEDDRTVVRMLVARLAASKPD